MRRRAVYTGCRAMAADVRSGTPIPGRASSRSWSRTLPLWWASLLVVCCLLPRAGATFYSDLLGLGWLCSTNEDSTFVRSIPWDCTGYILCHSGTAFTFQCEEGTLFNPKISACDWPAHVDVANCNSNPLGFLDEICRRNPRAKLPSPVSCSQFFDCTQNGASPDYAAYVLECPYPTLFNPRYQRCQWFTNVRCGQRSEPKAPCDYIQYQQLCINAARCRPCEQRHPNCVNEIDGFQPIRDLPDHYKECFKGRTLLINRCAVGHLFSYQLRRCVPISNRPVVKK